MKIGIKGIVISGGDINSVEKIDKMLQKGLDLVYEGRPFISNPDYI